MASRDIVGKEQDMTSLLWGERVNSSGTAGTYLKAVAGVGARAVYYKLPRYNGVEFDGHECVNEVIASRLMDILGVEHLSYRLIHARVVVDGKEHEVWLNSSKNYRRAREKKLSLGLFVDLNKETSDTPLDVCKRFGWMDAIRRMMLVDYVVANRDRHASNIEVLIGPDGTPRLAPLFDTGLSLLAPLAGDAEAIDAFDPLRRVATTNYLGSRSLEENLLNALPIPGVSKLEEGDRERLLSGLDGAMDARTLDKIWEIVWARWCYYASL